MIRLGLRLNTNGGRESLVRLAVTAVGVALGVGLLLASLASMNAGNAQNTRGAWLNQPQNTSPASALRAHSVWWLSVTDEFAGRTFDRIDVAATGPRSSIPPGLPRLPKMNEYFVSPALSALLRTTPAAEL